VELDRRDIDDCVRRPRVEAEVVLGLEVVVTEADAARVDVERAADPAELGDVDVSSGEDVRSGAGELLGRVLREDDAVVVSRRAVEAEQAPAAEVELDRRCERAQVLEVGVRELRERPLALDELPLGRLLRTRVRVEQEGVGVAHHGQGSCVADELEALDGLRPALGDVAEGDDRVGVAQGDVVERRAQPDGVPVRVRDERDAYQCP